MSRRGIALLLTVGILVLLSLAGVAMVGMAAQLRLQTGAQSDAATVRLLARSGIEYASARLFQDSSKPAVPTQGNQPDDWTYRDPPGTPLEKARNPSYA